MPWTQPSVVANPAELTSSWDSQPSGPGRIAASRIITLTAPGNRTAWTQVRRAVAGSMSRANDVMNT